MIFAEVRTTIDRRPERKFTTILAALPREGEWIEVADGSQYRVRRVIHCVRRRMDGEDEPFLKVEVGD